MFRAVGVQESLWESTLPEELRRLPGELARVDVLLDDPAFFAPVVPFFDPQIGRPSTPMETYLRLMFLKFRYGLGYELLCREVTDSITWRRFCRIRLDGSVPHRTTLMKLTTRCGSTAVDGLNEALLAQAVEAKLLRTTKLRADTTVVPSNVSYPTDSGLLAKAIRRIVVTGKRIQAAGGATRTGVGDRSRAAGKRAHAIGAKLRSRSAAGRDEALAAVRRVIGELANAKRSLRRAGAKAAEQTSCGGHDAAAGRRRGRLARAVDDLSDLVQATRQIAAQTRQWLAGQTRTGPLGESACTTPTPARSPRAAWAHRWSFGHKAQIVEGDDGVIVDHNVEQGNPADALQLAPAVQRVIKRTGRKPRTVTADRG